MTEAAQTEHTTWRGIDMRATKYREDDHRCEEPPKICREETSDRGMLERLYCDGGASANGKSGAGGGIDNADTTGELNTVSVHGMDRREAVIAETSGGVVVVLKLEVMVI